MKTLRRVLSVSTIALSVALGACTRSSPDELVRSAKSYIAKKDSKAAIIELKSALQAQPEFAEARLLLGTTLLESGDPVSADVELRKALALKQPEATVVPSMARALIQLGQERKLIEQFSSTTLDQPEAAADLKTSLAIAFARQGKRSESTAALQSALTAVPEYGPARRVQAQLDIERRDYDGALKRLEQVLLKAPDDYEAQHLRGDLLLYAKGDATAAKAAYRKALNAKADYLPAHASTVKLLIAQQDSAAAKAQLDELKKYKPVHLQTKFLEAELALLNKDYTGAKELVQQVMRVVPDHPGALRLAGAVEYQIGSPLQAEKLLSRSLTSENHAPTRMLLAKTYLRSGSSLRALETLAPLLDGAGVDVEALALAGQVHLQSGDAAKAETYFKQAASLSPKDTRVQTALALTQLAKGNSEVGYSQLQRLASADSSTLADMALISAYFSQSKLDEALKAIDALEKKEPGKPVAAELRSRVQIVRKDFASARQSLEKSLALDPLYLPAASKLAGLDIVDKKPDQAKARFDAVLKADPKNVQALVALSEIKGQAGGSREEVAGLLRDAIRLNPTVAAPRQILIEHHLRFHDVKAALATATDAVAAIPDNPQMLDTQGRVQMRAGEFNQAKESFNRLAQIQPGSAQPLLRLADAHLASKNHDAARQDLKRALAIAPNLLAAQRGMVMVEVAAGRPIEALAVAKSVQRTPHREAVGSLLVGEVEETQQNWAGAAAAYRAGLKIEPNSQLAMKLHSVLRSARQPVDAQKFAAEWAKSHPQDTVFVQYLGDRALAESDFAVAESHFLDVLVLQPSNAVAHNNVAWVMTLQKNPEALNHAEKANELAPNQPAFMDTLAMALASANQLPRAIEIEKQAIALQAQPAYRLNLARFYLQAGDKQRARIELEQLAKLGAKFSGQSEVSKLLPTL